MTTLTVSMVDNTSSLLYLKIVCSSHFGLRSRKYHGRLSFVFWRYTDTRNVKARSVLPWQGDAYLLDLDHIAGGEEILHDEEK